LGLLLRQGIPERLEDEVNWLVFWQNADALQSRKSASSPVVASTRPAEHLFVRQVDNFLACLLLAFAFAFALAEPVQPILPVARFICLIHSQFLKGAEWAGAASTAIGSGGQKENPSVPAHYSPPSAAGTRAAFAKSPPV